MSASFYIEAGCWQPCFFLGRCDEHSLVLLAEEVALLLRVTPKVVYELHRRGALPGRYISTGKRALRFSRDTVLEWLRSGHVPPSKKGRPHGRLQGAKDNQER